MMERSENVNVEIVCKLGDEYFVAWEELSQELKEFWETNDSTQCDGRGGIGLWCEDCSHCKRFSVETV